MSSDRDRILEQALKHELGAAGTPPAGAPALRSFSEGGCLDAETLGAWTDGALAPAAMAAAAPPEIRRWRDDHATSANGTHPVDVLDRVVRAAGTVTWRRLGRAVR